MIKFGFAIAAVRARDGQIRLITGIVTARNRAEALGMVYEESRRALPETEGYGGHVFDLIDLQ